MFCIRVWPFGFVNDAVFWISTDTLEELTALVTCHINPDLFSTSRFTQRNTVKVYDSYFNIMSDIVCSLNPIRHLQHFGVVPFPIVPMLGVIYYFNISIEGWDELVTVEQ
jgi:hypothetical protein